MGVIEFLIIFIFAIGSPLMLCWYVNSDQDFWGIQRRKAEKDYRTEEEIMDYKRALLDLNNEFPVADPLRYLKSR